MPYGHSRSQQVAYAPPAPGHAPAARRSAPPSVLVIAILQYVGGFAALVIAAVIGYGAVLVAQESSGADLDIDPDALARLLGLAAAVVAVIGVVSILLGYKIQRGRQWARVLVLILSVLSLAGVVASVAAGWSVSQYGLGLIYPPVCLLLLNTRAARSWFRWRTW